NVHLVIRISYLNSWLCNTEIFILHRHDLYKSNESSKSRNCATFEALNRLLFRIPFSRVNITVGALEERVMLSGMHTVADIFCCCCGQIVGWKYEAAHEKSQKYKEGKFVLERLVRSFASDRGRIVDEIDFSSEVYIDTRPSMSDGEDA
ncbi:hypothetical protein Gorai_022399, partial [Gossypium raimondii]|nr:hypothetical protein [Gossypium raimondii]